MTHPDDHEHQAVTHEFQPDWSLHPGAILNAELDARGMTPADLADRAGLPAEHIDRILAQITGIDPDTAAALDGPLGIPAGFWTRADAAWREHQQRTADDHQHQTPAAETDHVRSIKVSIGIEQIEPTLRRHIRRMLQEAIADLAPNDRRQQLANLKAALRVSEDEQAIRAVERERVAEEIAQALHDEARKLGLSELGTRALVRAAQIARRHATASEATAAPPPGSTHRYLSTACLHGLHDHCNAMVGYQGVKRPAQCKFCPAMCRCNCHNREAGNG